MFHLSFLLLALSQAPDLLIEAPPGMAVEKLRMESIDRTRLEDVVRLVGLKDPGRPIHIELVSGSAEQARSIAPWIAGFARQDTVVIFPSRSPSYPDHTLDDVLRHEVAHALIWRATSGRPIPRWFNEGLAMAAERPGFRDETQLFIDLAMGSRLSLYQLDRLFDGGQADQTRAYLVSRALVRELLTERGQDAGGRILAEVRKGVSFETAFLNVIGRSTAEAQAQFYQTQSSWTTWISILASQEVLWVAITLLAILAIWRKRKHSVELRRRWEEEEED